MSRLNYRNLPQSRPLAVKCSRGLGVQGVSAKSGYPDELNGELPKEIGARFLRKPSHRSGEEAARFRDLKLG